MPAYDANLFALPAPVAMVTLRNQATGNTISGVPMLLDTGADVTLIPQSSAIQLGLAIDSRESYELVGFDGSLSTAPVVQLDLFLLGRLFKGRFVVVNQSYGIIGRNVINNLTLVFDGPRLNWSDQRSPGLGSG